MATDAAAVAGEHAEKAGMPQLDFSTFPNQIFWLLVALVVIYLVLSQVALPRIGAILADRKGRIEADLTAAEQFKQQAVAAEKSYNDALVQARTEAAKIVAAAKIDIQKDLDVAIAAADTEISAKATESEGRITEIRAGATQAVQDVALATAGELVAALGGTVDAGSITAAVAARLKG